VLGAVLDEPRSVAEIARHMGLARQSVQRLADCLVEEDLAAYRPNPRNRRAKLLVPRPKGRRAIEILQPRQWAWADRVGGRIGASELRQVNDAIRRLLSVLDEESDIS
jgi:DNA-binding MarR family transcriptional regulator